MPVEMFPRLGSRFRSVSARGCAIEARAFLSGTDPGLNGILSHDSEWYWQTIRDLMLSGF